MQNLCIHQIDHLQNEKIIKTFRNLNNPDNFLDKIIQITNNLYDNITTLTNINISELKSNPQYPPNYYLLNNQTTIHLISKSIKLNPGYIYNSNYTDTDILYTFKLIDFEDESDDFEYQYLENFQNLEISESELLIPDLNLKEIEIKDLNYNSNIFIADKKSSTTIIVNNIINNYYIKNDNPILVIISKNDDYYLLKYPTARLIKTNQDIEELQFFMSRCYRHYNFCILLDDIFIDDHLNPYIRELIYNGKQYRTTIINTYNFSSKLNLTNHQLKFLNEYQHIFDYIFIGPDYNNYYKEIFYKYFGSFYLNLQEFCDDYEKCFIRYCSMVLDKNNKVYQYNSF
jgi:hypothetical protein